MSGYGGYNYTYDNWTNTVNAEINGNVAIINGYPSTRSVLERNLGKSTPKTILRLKVSIEIKNNPNKLPIRMYFTGAADYPSKSINITESGIYELPQVTSNNYEGNGYYIGFQLNNNNLMEGDENYYCRIQLLPEYPDALVFDGVDDYGINENMPILDDFTLIIKNKWFDLTKSESFLISKSSPAGQDGAFILGRNNNSKREIYYSYYEHNTFNYQTSDLLYITPKSYNGNNAVRGTSNDSNVLNLGTIRKNDISRKFVGAFYSAYLFDRSLDEQEIKEFIRKYIDPEYLLPSEIPTPDCYYDFSLGSNDDENRETIKDQSGNGNDAKAYNFAWNEEGSGYKDGALYLDGTDDYIALEAFDSGFKTVFMLCSWKIENVINYDQRNNNDYENALNTSSQDINYYGRNRSGKTYINGILSTKVKNNLTRNKKHLITGTFFGGSNTTTPCIGSNNSGNGYFSNLTLYKFLGFKEELTEEQIKAIIKKYNLLDGVDEIEVS